MGVRLSNQAPAAQHRWIKPYPVYGAVGTTAIAVAGRVYLSAFEISEATIVDGIQISNFATVAGNVTVGIYKMIAEETTLNAVLIIESASTAQAGVSTGQLIPITATSLSIGRYYLAVEYSDATATYGKINVSTVVKQWSQYYDRAGGYGALTNPCPATTDAGALTTCSVIRCVQ
jgi:hypothetical protein